MKMKTTAEKKFSKKYYKKTLNFLKDYGDEIKLSSVPTPHIFVGNGGMLCERRREEILTLFNVYGPIVELIMIPNKSFSFLSYKTAESATKAVDLLTSYVFKSNKDDGPVAPLYLFYLQSSVNINNIFSSDNTYPIEGKPDLINGLILEESFIDEDYEKELIDFFKVATDMHQDKESTLKNRSVKHFGFEFLYGSNNIDRSKPLTFNIPDICTPLLDKVIDMGLMRFMPDQLTVNQYEPGQGIPSHIDTHSAFEDGILSVSLGHQVAMDFSHSDNKKVSIILPRRSALVMTGESRYLWCHGIAPRSYDIYYAQDATSEEKRYHLALTERGLRISLTFRKVLYQPCCCVYTEKCDSQREANSESEESLYVPDTNHEAINLEGQHVYEVYEEIAAHFSDTRHTPWPRIKQFLCGLKDGSLLADVGCGNGKYLGVNPKVMSLGSDRSSNLLTICDQRGFEVHLADCLHLPYRSNSFDATICIAVIHHLSTKNRRLDALKELVRITCVDGLVLVYVWALEQKLDDIKSNADHSCEHLNICEDVDRCRIEVSEGRNIFQQQDLLIPWHLKEEGEDTSSKKEDKVFHRFYHVFKQGELQTLCRELENVQLIDIYFDKGNWCAILKKITKL